MPTQKEWTDVESSMMTAAAYADSRLFIRFKNGRVFSYDAPRDVYDGLIGAESAGRYLNAEVKGVYDFREESD